MSIKENNMATPTEKRTVMSRIALKIDTWENWQKDSAKSLVLHAGEVAFVQMGTVPPIGANGTSEVLFKVGDGTTTFENLPWGSAKAADVYGWAKQNETEFKNWLSGETKVGGEGANKDNPAIGDPFVLKSVFDNAVTSISGSITTLDNSIKDLVKATTDTDETTSLASRLAIVEGLAGIGGDEGTAGSLATVSYVDKEIEDATKALVGSSTSTTVATTIAGASDKAEAAGTAASDARIVADRAEDKVDILIGDVAGDANLSVREIANDELAKQLVPENAKESLNSLQEIAAWIQSHPDDAAELNRLLAGLGTTTTGEGETAVTKAKTVKEYVDGAVGAEATARATEISTAIQGLDMAKLEVGAGETIKEISETDGVVKVAKQGIVITKSQITDFAHEHDDDYAAKTTTDEHIANTDIHVTKPQKDSWTTGAEQAGTAVQSVTFNGTEVKNGTTVALTAGTGDANGQVKINGTNIDVKGLGSAAYTSADAYAAKTPTESHIADADIHVTPDQKESWDTAVPKAESAIQGVKVNGTELTPDGDKKVDVKIESGSANGTIKVNNSDVAVTGLGSAAYTDAGEYASSTDFSTHVTKAVTTETYLLIDCGSSTVNVD